MTTNSASIWGMYNSKYKAGNWMYKFEAAQASAGAGKAVCLSSDGAVLAS